MGEQDYKAGGRLADAYRDSLGPSTLEPAAQSKPVTGKPVVTREVLRQRLAESGVSPRQIERFLDPRSRRLRAPMDVTNWSAYELLRGVYSTISDSSKFGDIELWMKAQGPAALKQRDEIRLKLQHSGLAQVLPGGFDLLPDYYTALPAWARPWQWLLRPRNFYQLGRHVAGNLRWYLDPSTKIHFIFPWQWLFILPPLAVPLLSKLLSGKWTDWFLIVFVLAVVPDFFFRKRRSPIGQARFDIERIELYQYLCEEYSQAVDHTPV